MTSPSLYAARRAITRKEGVIPEASMNCSRDIDRRNVLRGVGPAFHLEQRGDDELAVRASARESLDRHRHDHRLAGFDVGFESAAVAVIPLHRLPLPVGGRGKPVIPETQGKIPAGRPGY